MKTLTIELVNDKAIDLLKDLEALELIRLIHPSDCLGVRLGSLEGLHNIPDDFNEPLDLADPDL